MYDAIFKIVIFGEAGTGKVELTQRLLTNLYVTDSKMTIGVDYETKSLNIDDIRVRLQIWDFGGEELFRFLLPTYLRGARGGMFVYDITNYSTIAHIDDWLTVIKKEIRAEDIFPILVVGNRAHLADQREVPAEDAIKIAKSRSLDGFIECSAKTGENVEEAFIALTRLLLELPEPREIGVRPSNNNESIPRLSDPVTLRGGNKIIPPKAPPGGPLTSYPYILKSPKVREEVYDILKKLLAAIPEVQAAALVSNEGLPIVSVLQGDVNEKKIAAITAALCSLAKKAISELKNGDFDQLYIRYSDGYLLVRQVSPDAILIASADKVIRLGRFFPGTLFPYNFKPPDPPDDLDGTVVVQVQGTSTPDESEIDRYCKYCGAPLDEGVSVCPNCKNKNP